MRLKPAAKITLLHILIGLFWIYLSDRILSVFMNVNEGQEYILFQNIKGALYIITTGSLLYFLLKSFYKKNNEKVEELEARQAELSELQQVTLTCNWEYDIQLKTVNCTAVAHDIFEIDGALKNLNEFFLPEYLKHIENRAVVLQALANAGTNGESFDLEFEIITAKGNEKWIRMVGKPFMKYGKELKIFGSYQDITLSKINEQKITRLNRVYNFITDLNKAIVKTADEQTLLKEVCDIAVNIGHFRMAWIGKLEESTKLIIPFVYAGAEDGYLTEINTITIKDEPEGRGPTSMAIKELKPFYSNDLETDALVAPWRAAQLQRGYYSSIALPIIKFGKVFGVFSLYAPVKNFFDDKEIGLLQDATADIAHALENIRKENLRMEAETSLAKSEEQYRMIVETASEGIWMIDENGFTSFANRQMVQMLGYNNGELMGKHLSDFMDEEGKLNAIENIQRREKGIAEIHDFRLRKKDGTFLWAQLNTNSIFKNEQYDGALAMITDISSRKEAEAKMIEALDRYEMVAKATSDTIWDWDIVNDCINYNKGITQVFGYKNEEIKNIFHWWKNNIHKSNRVDFQNLLDEVFLNREQVFQTAYRFRCSDGNYKYVVDRAFVTYDNTGKPIRIIGTMQDVTKETESESRIEKAVTIMQEQERQQMGMELHDNVNQILAVSLLYLGLTKEGIEKKQDVTKLITQTEDYIKHVADEVRRLSHELAPVSFNDFSLKQVFDILISNMNAGKLFTIKMEIAHLDNVVVPVDLKINFYRILQEQLNNIIKHAHAKEVIITLTKEDEVLKLLIADDGKGFDTKIISTGIGLENIKRRVKLFSGNFSLHTAPGKGCEIIVEVPVEMD